ncbi:MAG TPA: DedA family protein [Gaiellaceae bacterium]|jgi:membrane protein DedA with SNARE-associated domain
MTHELETYGLILLFLFVAVEGCGIPIPGESALIASAVLAGSGHFNIVEVIAVAAVAAIIGDNSGYWIARLGGRALLQRIPIVRDALPKLLPKGERFFERHGPKTIVVARFIAGLRITAAWLAGISHMPWKRFAVYNAAGGTLWATTIGLAAYEFGQSAVDAVTHYGVWAVVAIVIVVAIAFFAHRVVHKRMENRHRSEPAKSEVESSAIE